MVNSHRLGHIRIRKYVSTYCTFYDNESNFALISCHFINTYETSIDGIKLNTQLAMQSMHASQSIWTTKIVFVK